jgi:hypothetical protein
MQPEISHRCVSCGAALREPAMFCPECGKPLAVAAETSPAAAPDSIAETPGPNGPDPSTTTDEQVESAPPVTEAAVVPAEDAAVNSEGPRGSLTESAGNAPGPAREMSHEFEESEPDPKSNELEKDDSDVESKAGARGKTRERLHRAGSAASSVARHALDDNVKRVEKIHHVSTAMFEEATYDPSLRFVLVALGLFLVFVILLVLSKVME